MGFFCCSLFCLFFHFPSPTPVVVKGPDCPNTNPLLRKREKNRWALCLFPLGIRESLISPAPLNFFRVVPLSPTRTNPHFFSVCLSLSLSLSVSLSHTHTDSIALLPFSINMAYINSIYTHKCAVSPSDSKSQLKSELIELNVYECVYVGVCVCV